MSRTSPGKVVPVVVLAGFLGAGKTTVLNHLLVHSEGRRFGVLVNDFGAVNIDALLVSGRSAGRLNLSNGCICCTTDAEGLTEALAGLAGSGVDAIVVEASGIAEPRRLIRLVSAARDERVAYGGLVYVVDAAQIERTLAEHPEIGGHLAVADLVLVNKRDLVAAEDLDRAMTLVRRFNDSAPVLAVSGGALDPGLLAEGVGTAPAPDEPRQLTIGDLVEPPEHRHLHEDFESASLETADPVNPRLLAEFLKRPPAGAYRCKGLVFVDLPGHRGHAYEVHAVGGFVSVRTRPWEGTTPSTRLVVIGAGLDRRAAQNALARVVLPADPADETGILLLTRYLAVPAAPVTGD